MKILAVGKRLWRDERGQDLTEYALLVVLLALAVVLALKGFALPLSNAFGAGATNLT